MRSGLVVGAALVVVATAAPALAAASAQGPSPSHAANAPTDATARAGSPRAVAWQEAKVAEGHATGAGLAKVDAHTTWVAGMRFQSSGDTFSFAPTLWERDDRKGKGWKERATVAPPAPYGGRWNDVDASSGKHAVLVGDYAEEPAIGGVLTQHWNGRGWKNAVAPVPEAAINAGFLSVDARTATDAWAAGWAQVPLGPDDSASVGLLQHWDGKRWTPAKLPAIGGQGDGWSFDAVTALAADDVWAVGGVYGRSGKRPLLLHYDGTSWTEVAGPDLGNARAGLATLAVGPRGELWAGGKFQTPDGTESGLLLRYAGGTWSRVSLPAGTGPVASVTVSRGEPVVLSRKSDAEPAVLRGNANGTRWAPLDLPSSAAEPLGGVELLAYGKTVEVLGTRPNTGEGARGWHPVMLSSTATRVGATPAQRPAHP